MSKSSMLEYSKVVLEKVSFDREIFTKEFKKAINMLVDHEVQELKRWVIATFGKEYCALAM